MAQQTINVGSAPNDGTGTPLRTAFQYTNSNFTELYTAVGPSGNNIVVPGTATITGDLTVATSALKVTGGKVGIGTASPAYELDVSSATASNQLRIFGSNQNSITFGNAAGGASNGFLMGRSFSSDDANNLFVYDIANSALRFFIGNTGNVGIGTAAPTEAVDVNSGNLKLTNGNVVLGTSGKGIDFSATTSGSGTMTSELLSDYEEGTWTPSFQNITLGNGTVTGFYTKIGNTVSVMFRILFGSTTSVVGNVLTISGLPFSIDTMAVGYVDLLRQGISQYAGVVTRSSATVFNFRALTVSGSSVVSSTLNATAPATWGTGDEFTAQITYRAS